MYWKLVGRTDSRARALADKHYSRQHIGASEFCAPGNNIVLVGLNNDALWVSHRPDPRANLPLPRADGFLYWDNAYFRSECEHVASELILQAIAVTLYLWQDDLPRDGYHSFIDPRKVKPTMRRGSATWGYSYLKAGFALYPELTKARRLLRFVMSAEKMRAIQPLPPVYEQLRLFA